MWRFIEYLCFVIRTKGIIGGLFRIGMLVARFDFSGARMRRAISDIAELGRRFGYKPTLFVPAVVLSRHKKILRDGTYNGLELALHGYTHRNLRPLCVEAQVLEISKAKAVFEVLGIQASGFRAPYLSRNECTEEAVCRCGLRWNSDKAFMAAGILNSHVGRPRRFVERAVQRLYVPDDAAERMLAPWIHKGLVCIPILLPDDEILVDRLGVDEPRALAEVWLKMLKWTMARGGLFVLQLHPERFQICGKAMEMLLEEAKSPDSRTWIASMSQIADWWVERDRSRFEITQTGLGCYRISFQGPRSATVVGLNLPKDLTKPFHGGYRQIMASNLGLQTGGPRPCIGIHPDCSQELVEFIKNAGFAFERSDKAADYAFYLGPDGSFCRQDETRLLRRIESCGRPIMRCWPWPDGYKSAFTTTHDLDCVTLTDFLYRIAGR